MKKDLRTLAEAVDQFAIRNDVSHGMNAYNICRYCEALVYWNEASENIEHHEDCAYLVAKRILGAKS